MKSTKTPAIIQKQITTSLFKEHPIIQSIAQAIHEHGGQSYLVGGAVRDMLLDQPIKDLDIEVHGISLEQLERILKKFGHINLVGKSFGVLRLSEVDADWSLPRTDKAGRKPEVTIDKDMSIEDAFRRRDLTINAMGINLMTHELVDPFGGQEDLKKEVLKTPDPRFFIEDPLRFFRVMQFIGRFEMEPDQELNQVCKEMDISNISRERIEQEFAKLFLKSKRPSLGIRWLALIGRLHEVLPELAQTIGVVQGEKWHPEGDVFEHTMQALDAAARFEFDDPQQKLILMYAALCHDLGKAHTTEIIDGKVTSRGHAEVGAGLAKKMLKRIMRNKDIIQAVTKLVKYHMEPLHFLRSNAKPAAYKRLANKLAPDVTINMLVLLAFADRQGRNADGSLPLKEKDPEIQEFLNKAKKAKVEQKKEEPILHGRDIMDLVEPGPEMGDLLDYAYEMQIEENIKDKKALKKLVKEKLKKKK